MPDFSSTTPSIKVKNPGTGQYEMWSSRQIVDYYSTSPIFGSRSYIKYDGTTGQRNLTASLEIDSNWYMSDGPGKYINPLQFPILEKIFDNPDRLSLGQSMSIESYSKIFNISRSLPQQEYLRVLSGNGDRSYAYIFGESSFALKGEIVRDTSGNINIENIYVKPFDDQFNIEPDKNLFSQGIFANISNAYLDSNRIPGKEVGLLMAGSGKSFSAINKEYYQSSFIIRPPYNSDSPYCFLAGTQILMENGNSNAIENIKRGDTVISFSKSIFSDYQNLLPKNVSRIFLNITSQIIDLRGLYCTPGHVFLTGKIENNNENLFATIFTTLCDDSTLVEHDGTIIRARTGARLESVNDTIVRVVCSDSKENDVSVPEQTIYVRAGIPIPSRTSASDPLKASSFSLAQYLSAHGIVVLPDGSLVAADGARYDACDWPEGSTPFDTAEMRNWIVEANGQPYTPPWISDLTDEGEHEGLRVVGETVRRFPTPGAQMPSPVRPL